VHLTQEQGNTEVRLYNPCCSGKATNITYSERLSVALVIHHAMRMLHVVSCGLSEFTIFSTFSHKREDVGKEVFLT